MDSSQFPREYTQDAAAMTSSSSARPPAPPAMEKRGAPRPHSREHPPLHCPRCNSSNTKFCYYNNYSLSQPRHFCKACKRYWTEGGTLRNVPVGGGSRKNKRAPSPFPLASPSPPKKILLVNHAVQNTNPDPNPSFYEGHGLVNLSGLFHAGPLLAAPMQGGCVGFDGNMQEGAGGDCYGYWMNGMMGGEGSI